MQNRLHLYTLAADTPEGILKLSSVLAWKGIFCHKEINPLHIEDYTVAMTEIKDDTCKCNDITCA